MSTRHDTVESGLLPAKGEEKKAADHQQVDVKRDDTNE